MKKRMLSILLTLCMVMYLVPASVLAASPATETADFTAADGGAAAIALLNNTKTGVENSTWDSSSQTLILKGVDFTTTATTAMKLPAGTTVVLADGTENTITGGDAAAAKDGAYTNKIYIYGIR